MPRSAVRAGAGRFVGCGAPGACLAAGQKLLLVLDQFEQWLHARRGEQNTELAAVLRQCDGERLQAIVLIRDDFWLAVSRFMAELEIDLVQGQNTALADLFDTRHARKVLTRFGQAYGTIPDRAADLSRDQASFLDRSVSGLAQDGIVVSVRLALFAEMVKGKPWTPATLRDLGGTEGVGVAFLEETFGSPQANPRHRLHRNAAQAVLKALLPEAGTDIKGQMRSESYLRDASGYASRPADFSNLIRILDGELRLITPTDPEGIDGTSPMSQPAERHYQLTHDYLVPSLREWLTRKQRETRSGRAELRLARRGCVERQARETPSALGPGVGEDQGVDAAEILDRPSARDDEASRAGTRAEIDRIAHPGRVDCMGRVRVLRLASCRGPGSLAPFGEHHGGAGNRRRARGLSPLGRSCFEVCFA